MSSYGGGGESATVVQNHCTTKLQQVVSNIKAVDRSICLWVIILFKCHKTARYTIIKN